MLTDRAKQLLVDFLTLIAIAAMIVILLVGTSGCLAAKLRQPVHEHNVQLQTLCHVAPEEAPSMERDVCEAATHACLLQAIVQGEDGASCQ